MATQEHTDHAVPTTHPSLTTSSRPQNEISIATRKSTLARAQTNQIASLLSSTHPHITTRILASDTKGDVDKSTPLHAFNAKALWTTELEDLLRNGEADCIVHSLKDMPTQLPQGLVLGCVLGKEDSRDAVIISPRLYEKGCRKLADLPEGSVVGAGLRRGAQIRRRYPHLKTMDCRGNIDTRLAKVDRQNGDYAAIVMAAAGLTRLGWEGRISQMLSKEEGGVMGAVGQGRLGIEIREGDARMEGLLKGMGDEKGSMAALAERSVMRTLEGGCSVPIGVETEWIAKSRSLAAGDSAGVGRQPAEEYGKSGKAVEAENVDQRSDELIIRAIVVSLDGQQAAEAEMRRPVRSREEADQLGWDTARQLVEKGAAKILEEITLNRNIIEKQGEA